MLTSVNYISVTVWVLGGILILFAIGLIMYRCLFESKAKKVIKTKKKVGAVSKAMNDFILSFSNDGGELIFHNILFKNKFAKSKYSIIPALIIKGKDAFIIGNVVSKTKSEQLVFNEGDIPYVVKGKRVIELNDVNYSWYREIQRFLESKLGDEFNYEIVCPVLNSEQYIVNHTEKKICYVSEFESYIESISNGGYLEENEKDKIIKKMESINLFKNKVDVERMKRA